MSKTDPALRHDFPIVAIGASAGGLEAFESFFDHMPNDSGMAFILISHLSPEHDSVLPQLIQKYTAMPVQAISNNMRVCRNQVYVIPPKKRVSIKNGYLGLEPLGEHRTRHLPIDSFFASLADDQGSNGICIVLSGTGSDGTLGITQASDRIGSIFAQDEASAKFPGMPNSAVATGLVDFIMPPSKMPSQLVKFASPHHSSEIAKSSELEVSKGQGHSKIYELLYAFSGDDFSQYKKNTLNRRIERRMHLHNIDEISDYVDLLEQNRSELSILFKELLIGVTQFFRDSQVFDALRDHYLPTFLKDKNKAESIRVWVAGCSTGEEAYSLAIVLHETMVQMKRHHKITIFATDLDKTAIDTARAGLYPSSIEESVSPERLKLHFYEKTDGHYKVKKSLREKVIFATHNVIQDPPFSNLDILSCRNLLIYFSAQLQRKLLPYFHYSLHKNGLLILGSSETVGDHIDLFTVVDKKNKFFRRKESSANSLLSFRLHVRSPVSQTGIASMPLNTTLTHDVNALQLMQTLLEQSDMKPCVIIDENNHVVYVHGRTAKFIELAQGQMSADILQMVKPELKTILVSALAEVSDSKSEKVIKNIYLKENDASLSVDITIKPIQRTENSNELVMVIFDEKVNTKLKRKSAANKNDNQSVSELEYELQNTKNTLKATIEALETANEELKSSNEELQSTNEELQSTNEEIQTSKEELQSLNEESSTVNIELKCRIDELSQSNDDIKNLLDSTHIATLFLDVQLGIRRFTPKLKEIIPLSTGDAGRSIQHFSTSLVDVDLVEFANQVLDDLHSIEIEVKALKNITYIMNVRPYRTLTNVIDGVVITFEDITERKSISDALQVSETRYRMLFEMTNDSIVIIDPETGAFKEANKFAYEHLQYGRDEFLSLHLDDVIVGHEQAEVLEKIEKNIINVNDVLVLKQLTKVGDILTAEMKAQTVTLSNKRFIMSTWRYK
jgi:two-component system CheB/CheR fusion protein